MRKLITIAASTILYVVAIIALPSIGVAASMGEVAIFTEQSGWIAQGTAAAEGEELADLLKSPKDVVTLSDKAIGKWAEDHTDNGAVDIIVTFGWFPTSLYAPGNQDPDDSVAELFLEGGKRFPKHSRLYLLRHTRRRCQRRTGVEEYDGHQRRYVVRRHGHQTDR